MAATLGDGLDVFGAIMKRRVWAAVMVMGAVLAAGCEGPAKDPGAKIDVQPSFAVQYATAKISPAVVRLDVVTEDFLQGQPRTSRSLGSGVIIDPDGHVLTNFHVAGRAKRLDITLANQEHVRATLTGSDHWTDLALVQMDMTEVKKKGLRFSSATLGDSSTVQLGQPVMAVGTPYGLTRTVTMGIVSNTDRFFEESSIGKYETGWFNNWIQTDAAINPGNSGGPLINLRGEVIGINTRGTTMGNNLGFAIPINVAKQVVKELLAHKKVARSYIGVVLQPMQDLEQYYDVPDQKGVMIASVEASSPAAQAGLKAEDVLLEVNGRATNARFPEQLADARKLISDYPVGSEIKVKVRRPGKPEPVEVTLKTEKLESVVTEEVQVQAWGLSVRDITRAYLREARLPNMQGVLLTGVRSGSPGDTAQLKTGDILLRVGNKQVKSAEELEAAVKQWSQNPGVIGLDVRRDRSELTLVVKPDGK